MSHAKRFCGFRFFVLAGSALVVLVAGGSAQAGAPFADTPDYFYDATGRQPLVVSESEVVVRVKSDASAGFVRPAFLPARVLPAELPESAARLEDRIQQRGFHVVRGADPAAVAALPGVEYVLPVLYRRGSPVPIYPTDRVVVAFRDAMPDEEVQALAESQGCDATRCERGSNRFILTVRNTKTVSPVAVANWFHERAETRYAHPDSFLPMVAYAPPTINDPLYISHQWHLDGDTSKGAEPNSDVNVETAWDTDNGPNAEGLSTVRVSILDECVEKLHPDLFPNWAAGRDYDVVPPDDDPSPDAGQKHGTSCAGVAVAAGNSIGVRGAAPKCGLIGVKFFGGTISDTADGFYFSVDPDNNGDHSDGAAIMSNSWGYADGTLLPGDVVAAISFAANSGRNGLGCLVLFAAANNDHTVNGVSALAQLPTVMAIGGTSSNAMHTEFSDVGPEVAVAAPTNDRGDDGVRLSWLDITTTDNTGESGYNGLADLDYTDSFGGTSSATPLAAGVLALIFSQDPTMTAAQARAIAQHTAVRLDEPYGRFDGITGHSHRLGFGKVDAGAAVVAARAGLRWPDRIKTMTANPAGSDVVLSWATPPDDYAGSLVVRSSVPFAWMPTDGQTYTLGQFVSAGVEVIYNGPLSTHTDVGASSGAFFYAAYARSGSNLYGFGAKKHLIRDSSVVFYDNCEGPDPGWTHAGPGDEWTRGEPTSANGVFGQVVVGSGPLAGTLGTRAIGGDNCWGTDLEGIYAPNADAYLETPLINLTGVTAPVFLEYYDWCLLETFYDRCTVEVVDAGGNFLGYLDDDTGGDYDWTQRVLDLTPYADQAIRIRFRITSDDLLQRDGWFLDEIRVVVAANVPLPPAAANVYFETTENVPVNVILDADDPNPATVLDYIITALPDHGSLTDPNNGPIAAVPYTLASHAWVVTYTPDTDYQGPDVFAYKANDGALDSNEATASLSVGTPVLAYDFPLNVNPGWVTEGQWQFGQPQGQGGDPATAYTGLYVYGYNLAGAYSDNLSPTHLTALPLNCTGLSRVTLDFARWLGVEAAAWDGASVEVSTDGREWFPAWSHSGDDLVETAWSLQSYHIGPVADDQPYVQVRWTMGPTDSNTTFCGWNLDDVQIRAIGTAPTNQPPYAYDREASTAEGDPVEITLAGVDSDLDPINFTIVALPEHGQLTEMDDDPIAAVPYTLPPGQTTVRYTPDGAYTGPDSFEYRVDDGTLDSNVAIVSIDVLAVAPFPFTDGFESGPPLADYWTATSTSTGRIRVTANNGPIGGYHVTMDTSYEGNYSLNELTLAVDLAGHSFVRLSFDWKDFADEAEPLPDTWTGSTPGDGVAVSADGVTWHRVADLFDPARAVTSGEEEFTDGSRGATYQTVLIDLDQAVADAGISYTNAFRIRFQQYDNNPIDVDGIAIDNVQLIQGTTDPLITTFALPPGFVDEPYGPQTLTAAGGDVPLSWTVLDVYGEEDLGQSEFATNGMAQGWQGDDVVFDYSLPFSFPFFGQSYTALKICSDGWVNFGAYVGSTYNNSAALLAANKRIAVLWDDLRTDQGGDIYVDEETPGQVTVRWDSVTRSGLHPCNFSLTLYDDGRIRLHYGTGNTSLTPTVGISAGDSVNYVLSAYDGAATLTDAASVEFDLSELPPGLSLSAGGVLSGTPTATGRFKPIFHLEDQSQRTDAKMVPLRIIPRIYGDWDLDGDCDLEDYARFNECMELPVPSVPCLNVFDDDENDHVDLRDYAAFQLAFTGDLS